MGNTLINHNQKSTQQRTRRQIACKPKGRHTPATLSRIIGLFVFMRCHYENPKIEVIRYDPISGPSLIYYPCDVFNLERSTEYFVGKFNTLFLRQQMALRRDLTHTNNASYFSAAAVSLNLTA